MGSRSSDSTHAEKVVAAPAGEQEARAVTSGDGPRAAAGAVAGMAVGELLELGVGADFWRTKAFERAGIPALTLSDGPNGLRYQRADDNARVVTESVPATCFPVLATVAATWDPELARQMGAAIGAEARSLGVDVVLGPGINIKRSPLCGRNFEYFSEDPLLTAVLAAAHVEGVQSAGAGACVKHFAANSQEFKRFASDSVVDERTLRELYLRAFEDVVRRARPEAVMSAYVKLNGTYCSDNRWLLTDVLRREWGFDGMVVSDWGGLHNRAAAYRAGCDLSMPGGTRHQQRQARRALRAGALSEREVRASAERVARLAQAHAGRPAPSFDAEKSRDVARRVAAEGQVLLKNNGVLPLGTSAQVALIGAFAEQPRYQGVGSSHINARRVSTLAQTAPGWTYAQGYDPVTGESSGELLREAETAARAADVAVVVVGLPEALESEGFDRADMGLPRGMNELVERVCAANARTVVVLMCGSPVEMPWEGRAAAVLWAGLAGEAGAEATYDVLTGAVNPSGKLAETWPVHAADAPCMGWWGNPHRQAQYREGTFVGYRYYETAGAPVAHCFGHGLSYTSFAYRGLAVERRAFAGAAEFGAFSEGDGAGTQPPAHYVARFTLANTGERAGAEVAQVYAAPPAGDNPRPALQLAGFARVELDPGEEREVVVELDQRAFETWRDGAWHPAGGTYGVFVGSSARDLRLAADLRVCGVAAPLSPELAGTWYDRVARNRRCRTEGSLAFGYPSEEDFAALLGRPVPRQELHTKGTYDETDSVEDMARTSRICRIGARVMRWIIERDYDDPSAPACRAALEGGVGGALFVVVNSSSGQLPAWAAKLVLRIANGLRARRRR